MERRGFIGAAIASAVASIGLVGKKGDRQELLLRPPGAKRGSEFLATCIRCGKCANACPNDCIRLHGITAGLREAYTPYIKARERACTLCGECARVCPSGALEPFADGRKGWLAGVAMGKARVNQGLGYSFAGRTCGACYRACPLAGEAIRIGVFETPHIQHDACVGCGLCEQACLHLPQAIRAIPTENLEDNA